MLYSIVIVCCALRFTNLHAQQFWRQLDESSTKGVVYLQDEGGQEKLIPCDDIQNNDFSKRDGFGVIHRSRRNLWRKAVSKLYEKLIYCNIWLKEFKRICIGFWNNRDWEDIWKESKFNPQYKEDVKAESKVYTDIKEEPNYPPGSIEEYKNEKNEKNEKIEKNETNEKNEKNEKIEKNEKNEKNEKIEKNEEVTTIKKKKKEPATATESIAYTIYKKRTGKELSKKKQRILANNYNKQLRVDKLRQRFTETKLMDLLTLDDILKMHFHPLPKTETFDILKKMKEERDQIDLIKTEIMSKYPRLTMEKMNYLSGQLMKLHESRVNKINRLNDIHPDLLKKGTDLNNEASYYREIKNVEKHNQAQVL